MRAPIQRACDEPIDRVEFFPARNGSFWGRAIYLVSYFHLHWKVELEASGSIPLRCSLCLQPLDHGLPIAG